VLKLSAFADEISADLDEQISACRENAVTHIELRSVNKINVLDFDRPLREQIKTKLAAGGLAVLCIASPIGKVKIDDSFAAHMERFRIAVEAAEFFGAPYITLPRRKPISAGTATK
jgi:3-dehydroshikimate dehydratase